MRRLTREQKIYLCNGYSDLLDILIKKEIILDRSVHPVYEINKFLKQEKSKLPLEAQIHLDYLTCHKDVLFEITFLNKEEKKKSITDGLHATGYGPSFQEGYRKALHDVRAKENAKTK